MSFEFDYFVSTDGGAASNGTADSLGFGSHCLQARTGQKQTIRLDFGRGVTNYSQRTDKSLSTYGHLIRTDSQLVVCQLTQSGYVGAAAMVHHC